MVPARIQHGPSKGNDGFRPARVRFERGSDTRRKGPVKLASALLAGYSAADTSQIYPCADLPVLGLSKRGTRTAVSAAGQATRRPQAPGMPHQVREPPPGCPVSPPEPIPSGVWPHTLPAIGARWRRTGPGERAESPRCGLHLAGAQGLPGLCSAPPGSGPLVFTVTATALLNRQSHLNAGIDVPVSGLTGTCTDVLLRTWIEPVRVVAPCRVVCVVDRPGRAGSPMVLSGTSSLDDFRQDLS